MLVRRARPSWLRRTNSSWPRDTARPRSTRSLRKQGSASPLCSPRSATSRRCSPPSGTSPWPATTCRSRSPTGQAFQAVLAEPDPRRAVALMACHLADLWSRYAPIADILHGAASNGEPALQELWDTSQQQRLTAARSFITALAGKGSLRDGLDHHTASDIAWLHMAPDNYQRLTAGRGWSPAAYQQWLTDTLTAALLPPPSG